MTLPSSPPIRFTDIRTELGYTAGTTVNINSSAVRTLANISSGTIRISDLLGKSKTTPTELNTSWYLTDLYQTISNTYKSARVLIDTTGRSYLQYSSNGSVWSNYVNIAWTASESAPTSAHEVNITITDQSSSVSANGYTTGNVGTGIWNTITSAGDYAGFVLNANVSGYITLSISIRKAGTTTPVITATTTLHLN